MTKQKGFTLIELLVVIAIIGILSSVVLSSLNTARAKAADSAVKSNLSQIRSQAELLYNDFGVYGIDTTPTAFTEAGCAGTADTLFADSKVLAQMTAAATASGGLIGTGRCVISAGGAQWAVSFPLRTDAARAWCVDSTGASIEVPAGDAGISPTPNFACAP